VRLRPRAGADILDLALDGRTGVVAAVEHDVDGHAVLAVVVDDDPGRDLGFARQPGHRFFFSPEEVEVIGEPAPATMSPPRILVAGIGNVFLGDDGFGVALAQRLSGRALPAGVEVADFGIRGLDLAFAMQEGYDAVMLLDATPRGGPPGTLYAIEVAADDHAAPVLDAHGMDPAKVLALTRSLGGAVPPTYLVGCEPQTLMDGDEDELVATLSAPVAGALPRGVELVESLLAQIIEHQEVPRS
jgi:hydrogenase maturation protease